MLILARKYNESIIIDGNIEVIVVEIRGDKVRLGIIAPDDVPVHRKEIAKKLQEEGQTLTKLQRERVKNND